MHHPPPELVLHARLCQQARGRWHALLAMGERLHGWFGPRIVSTWLLALGGLAVLTWLAA